VKGVLPGSNAERAGLQPEDVLLFFNGEALTEVFDLTYSVQQKKPGDRSILQIEREGKPKTVEVVFQAKQKDHQHGKQ